MEKRVGLEVGRGTIEGGVTEAASVTEKYGREEMEKGRGRDQGSVER